VPLALAMLNVSNPTIGAMDALSRLSHDQDNEVAHNAIIALGGFSRALSPDSNPKPQALTQTLSPITKALGC
jgi:hypothetical protein